MQNKGVIPTTDRELALGSEGAWPVAGVDEAGRGALAGPVVAGAVLSDWRHELPWHGEVRDSKQLNGATRERLYDLILAGSISVGVGIIPSDEIDRVGIAAASRNAMYRALEALSVAPAFVLIDWFTLPALRTRQEGVPGGDAYCLSIACASIIAKVTRDRLMQELDGRYRGYGFAAHKGYGTATHLRQLTLLGICPVHRLSFRPVRLVAAGLL
jgi:ribonuclease HII